MEENKIDEKEKVFRLNQDLKHLKSLRCRYKSMSDYCEPEHCICTKIGVVEREIEALSKP